MERRSKAYYVIWVKDPDYFRLVAFCLSPFRFGKDDTCWLKNNSTPPWRGVVTRLVFLFCSAGSQPFLWETGMLHGTTSRFVSRWKLNICLITCQIWKLSTTKNRFWTKNLKDSTGSVAGAPLFRRLWWSRCWWWWRRRRRCWWCEDRSSSKTLHCNCQKSPSGGSGSRGQGGADLFSTFQGFLTAADHFA